MSTVEDTCMHLLDRWFDPNELLTRPPNVGNHDTRASVYYALGLLRRESGTVDERAEAILNAVCARQWHCPGRPQHGTFAKFPAEFVDRPCMRTWRDFDPNWREFIGTAFILLLDRYRARLSSSIAGTLERALIGAAEGAYARDVPADYTNAALMSALLLVHCGERFGEAAWEAQGQRLAHQIHERFARHETFPEYNSPTYYGVDLCALALWRSRIAPAWMHPLGKHMEQGLWRDIARFYNRPLGTLCGPWLRSYGMDMAAYCALVGLWIAAATGERTVPLPRLDRPFGHAHDIAFAPLVAELADRRTAELAAPLETAVLPRTLSRTIRETPRLAAVAHLEESYMIGGLSAPEGIARRQAPQCCPAAVHWKTPGGALGWMRVFGDQPFDMSVSPGALSVRALATDDPEARTGIGLEAFVPDGIAADALRDRTWRLPGLHATVSTKPARSGMESDDGAMRVWFDTQALECTLQPSRNQNSFSYS